MSDGQLTCTFCSHSFPDTRTQCPHCAQPQIFPNVTRASLAEERDKLESRYELAKQSCLDDGQDDEFARFEAAAAKSHALFACPLLKLHREIASGTEIFETYYQLEALRLRSTAAKELDWQKLRPQAETELLGSESHIENLHYASLSLDWESLTSYGDCVVKLADEMIGHRSSCFEGNTAVTFAVEGNFDEYLRSDWASRGKISATVMAKRLQKGIADQDFGKILVVAANDPVDDEFIEVHVFGTLTARSFAEVRFFPQNSVGRSQKEQKRHEVYRDAIIEKLTAASVATHVQGANA